MFCINVWLTVRDAADVESIGELLRQAAQLSRQEPGCLRFEVYHSESDPQKYLLCERWGSEQDWKDHKERKAVTEIYAPQVLPKVDREPHFSTLVDG